MLNTSNWKSLTESRIDKVMSHLGYTKLSSTEWVRDNQDGVAVAKKIPQGLSRRREFLRVVGFDNESLADELACIG